MEGVKGGSKVGEGAELCCAVGWVRNSPKVPRGSQKNLICKLAYALQNSVATIKNCKTIILAIEACVHYFRGISVPLRQFFSPRGAGPK